MSFDQEAPDETDYRMLEESDERDAAFSAFVAGYARADAPLSSTELDVAAAAWLAAWGQGAAFEREWHVKHHPTVQDQPRWEPVMTHSITAEQYARILAKHYELDFDWDNPSALDLLDRTELMETAEKILARLAWEGFVVQRIDDLALDEDDPTDEDHTDGSPE